MGVVEARLVLAEKHMYVTHKSHNGDDERSRNTHKEYGLKSQGKIMQKHADEFLSFSSTLSRFDIKKP